MQYNTIIKSLKEFGRCISIHVRNLFIWCKNVSCSIFSSPWITDAMGCFIFTFERWTTMEYSFEVRNLKNWMAGIHHDVSNKKMLTFFNRRAIGVFKVLSITKLATIFESLIGIGKPIHHSLSFSFYYCLYTE